MQKTCSECGTSCKVTDEDLALLKKLSPKIGDKTFDLPAPTMCFQCRLQRRLAFYNVRTLHRRTCDYSGASMISIFSPDKPFTVYDKVIWWGDDWDPLSYGEEFDFNRPFFEQFRQLMERVPMLSLTLVGEHINSDYTNDNMAVKNCYFVVDGERAEDSMYGHTFTNIRSCIDFVTLKDCELCYDCIHCENCYNLHYSQYCTNCVLIAAIRFTPSFARMEA